jgi:hypothetical protein
LIHFRSLDNVRSVVRSDCIQGPILYHAAISSSKLLDKGFFGAVDDIWTGSKGV